MPDSLSLLRCHVDDSAYGFEATSVRGVHRWESVSPRSGSAPEGSVGLLEEAPVYPLPYLLGLSEDAEAGTGPVLLLDGFGVQVDRVSRPAQVPVDAFRSLPRPARNTAGRFDGLARIAGELTLCVNARQISPLSNGALTRENAWPADEPWQGSMGGDTRRMLCFIPPGADERTFLALSYRQVLEVAQGLTLTRLSSSNPCLVGLVDWRNRAIPVVDLSVVLGVGASPSITVSRVLIARSPRSRELFAFPAWHLAPVSLPLPEDSIVTRIIDPPSPYVRAAYGLNENGYLFVPDLEKIAEAVAS